MLSLLGVSVFVSDSASSESEELPLDFRVRSERRLEREDEERPEEEEAAPNSSSPTWNVTNRNLFRNNFFTKKYPDLVGGLPGRVPELPDDLLELARRCAALAGAQQGNLRMSKRRMFCHASVEKSSKPKILL